MTTRSQLIGIRVAYTNPYGVARDRADLIVGEMYTIVDHEPGTSFVVVEDRFGNEIGRGAPGRSFAGRPTLALGSFRSNQRLTHANGNLPRTPTCIPTHPARAERRRETRAHTEGNAT